MSCLEVVALQLRVRIEVLFVDRESLANVIFG